VDTPERAAKAMLYMCSGYSQTASGVVGRGVFEEETRSNVVLVRDIDVFSLCEHHMLPFIGKVMFLSRS
jgi:GTP cyclohydrolase I